MPIEGIVVVLDDSYSTDKSTLLTRFSQVLHFSAFVSCIEIFHVGTVHLVARLQEVIYFDEYITIRHSGLGIGTGQGHYALVVWISAIAHTFEVRDQ